jgi:hypothetical protein
MVRRRLQRSGGYEKRGRRRRRRRKRKGAHECGEGGRGRHWKRGEGRGGFRMEVVGGDDSSLWPKITKAKGMRFLFLLSCVWNFGLIALFNQVPKR